MDTKLIIQDLPPKWIISFLEVYKELKYCLILFPFFSSTWRMQNIRSLIDLLRRNPHWWSLVIPSAYGVKLDSRMLDKIVYVVGKVTCSKINTICSIALLINKYNDRLLPILWKFLLIPNRINKCMDLSANFSTPCFNQFCWALISTWWFVSFNF